MLRHIFHAIPCLLLLLLSACHYQWNEDRWIEPANNGIDSVAFREAHHYWRGDNFVATDSFYISTTLPTTDIVYDSANSNKTIQEGDVIVIDNIQPDTTTQPNSYWIRIATASPDEHGAFTNSPLCGWVKEHTLLEHTVPDRPLSRLIYHFSDRHFKIIMYIILITFLIYIIHKSCKKKIRLVHFNDINSFYPTFLCLIVAGLALLYQSIQTYVPETWIEYYFHPTINPLSPNIPTIMQLFLGGVWLIIFIGIATADEIRHQLNFTDGVCYLIGTCSFCGLLYIFFTAVIPPIISYFILPAYWIWAIIHFKRNQRPQYFCGNCGTTIDKLGKCPHCGAINTRSLL